MTDTIEYEGSPRSVWNAMGRGATFKCPACGEGHVFRKYLKVADTCDSCNQDLSHHRADDAPPYFTIFIVGHIIVPLMLWVEMAYRPEIWIHSAIWAPLTLILALMILPITKGAVVGLQWALRMHGFGGHED